MTKLLILFVISSSIVFSQSIPQVATNQCISLNKPIYCNVTVQNWQEPVSVLSDGSDRTVFDVTGPFEISLQVDAQNSTTNKFLIHWRAQSWVDRHDRDFSFDHIEIYTSNNSTDGSDGTWTYIKDFYNKRKDNVISIPNNNPKWVKIKELNAVQIKLSRLEVFENAPLGKRNDFWLFFGDSETKGNMGVGNTNLGAKTYFSDSIHSKFTVYYPIIINGGKGGERGIHAKDTLPVLLNELPDVTFVAFCYGLNDIIRDYPLLVPHSDPNNDNETAYFKDALTAIIDTCVSRNVFPIPARIPWIFFTNPYCTTYDDPSGINGVGPINTNEVDPLIASKTPYAINTTTNLPYADFETWYRAHKNDPDVFQTDKVHHAKEGINMFNIIWTNTASEIVYNNQSGSTTLKENNNLKSINIFPNPFINEIKISNNSNHITSYNVYNINGVLQKSFTPSDLKNRVINLPNLKPGVYFIEAISGNKKVIEKIIKLSL